MSRKEQPSSFLFALLLVVVLAGCGGNGPGPDKVAPELSARFPYSDAITLGSRLTVSGAVEDDGEAASVKVTAMNGDVIEAQITGTRWLAEVPVAPGPNSLHVEASDAAGNAVEATHEFFGGGHPVGYLRALDWHPELGLLVIDTGIGQLLKLDLTGERQFLASTRPGFEAELVVDHEQGRIFYSGAYEWHVFEIMPDGTKHTISKHDPDNAPIITQPDGMAIDYRNSRLLVIEDSTLIQVDLLADGARTILADGDTPGDGPKNPQAVAVDGNGRVFVADYFDSGAFRVIELVESDVTAWQVVSGSSGAGEEEILVGEGPVPPGGIRDMKVHGESLLALFADTVISVNFETGERTLVSGPEHGAGELFGNATALALSDSGEIFIATDQVKGSEHLLLWRMTPATGDREIVATQFLRRSPEFDNDWVNVDAMTLHDANLYSLSTSISSGSVHSSHVATGNGNELDVAFGDDTIDLSKADAIGYDAASERLLVFRRDDTHLQLLGIPVASPGNSTVLMDSEAGIGNMDVMVDDTSFFTSNLPIFDGKWVFVAGRGGNDQVDRIYAVDLATGNAHVLVDASAFASSSDAADTGVMDIALDSDAKQLLVLIYGEGLWSVSLDDADGDGKPDGDVSLISSNGDDGKGSGPEITAFALTVDGKERTAYLVADSGSESQHDWMMAVDLDSGDRKIVATANPKAGLQKGKILRLQFDPASGTVLVVDRGANALLQVDPASGEFVHIFR